MHPALALPCLILQALPGGGASYQLRAALACNSHHLNVASLTARVHWPVGGSPQVGVLTTL